MRIDIAGLVHPIFGQETPGPDQFQGLSFRVPRGVPTACRLGGNPLEMKTEPDPDDPARDVLHRPRTPLPAVGV